MLYIVKMSEIPVSDETYRGVVMEDDIVIEVQPDKKYAWTDCLVYPLGQEGSIICLSCPCKETDKSLCGMQPMAA